MSTTTQLEVSVQARTTSSISWRNVATSNIHGGLNAKRSTFGPHSAESIAHFHPFAPNLRNINAMGLSRFPAAWGLVSNRNTNAMTSINALRSSGHQCFRFMVVLDLYPGFPSQHRACFLCCWLCRWQLLPTIFKQNGQGGFHQDERPHIVASALFRDRGSLPIPQSPYSLAGMKSKAAGFGTFRFHLEFICFLMVG